MRSEDARPGVLVKVLDAAKRGGRGRIGTIEHTYGHPSYLAMEVRFEDGSAELYWHHELERVEEYAGNASGKQGSTKLSPSSDRNGDGQASAG